MPRIIAAAQARPGRAAGSGRRCKAARGERESGGNGKTAFNHH